MTEEQFGALLPTLVERHSAVAWERLHELLIRGHRAEITSATLGALRSAVAEVAEAAEAKQRKAEKSAARKRERERALEHIAALKELEQKVTSLSAEVADGRSSRARAKTAETELERLQKRVGELSRDRESRGGEATPKSSPRRAVDSGADELVGKGWRPTGSGSLMLVAAGPTTAGEVALFENLIELPEGLVILNVSVVNGPQEREVDAIVLAPVGAFTIEQKDLSQDGSIDVPVNRAATVGGSTLHGSPRTQARQQSQLLASLARREPAIDIGFVRPVLAFLARGQLAHPTSGNVLLERTEELVERLRTEAFSRDSALDPHAVQALLERLDLPVPSVDQLSQAGFGPS
jgi:hypothetical protein